MKQLTEVFRSRVFLFGLIVKLILLLTAGGHFLNELFIPFIDKSIINLGSNPWDLSPIQNFPYGTFL